MIDDDDDEERKFLIRGGRFIYLYFIQSNG